MSDYTIILAEDHTIMRQGIRNLIDGVAGLKVIGEAADGLTLLKLVNQRPPDMVILDISMPGMRGIEAAKEILTQHPAVHVLMLSMHKRKEFLAMALAAGARGYLIKEDTWDELLKAIDRIRNGQTYLSPSLVDAYASEIISISKGARHTGADPLSRRERQVLQLIAEGYNDREIGDKLCISFRTVNHHHSNIRAKLNLKGTAELVRYAISKGYVNGQP
jgi:DNA-binding NarL/FixJ family response regulator